MTVSSAIVVVVDRVSAGFLGPYGNTWIDTPHLNRLASQSELFEFALTDSPRLDVVYRSYWTGLHAMQPGASPQPSPLLATLRHHGATSILVTDEPLVARHELAEGFQERVVVAPAPADRAADEVELTQCAQVFAAAIERLQEVSPPFLFWLHARGMQGPWDAPPSFRRRFMEEGDPPPPSWLDPPARRLPPNCDPDEVLGVMQAYAGQVAVLDACLGALLDALDHRPAGGQPPAHHALLVFTSPRGFPLGEHGRLGAFQESLNEELLHVPWMIRFPHRDALALRRRDLVQPPDLHAALLAACRDDAPHRPPLASSPTEIDDRQPATVRDRACSLGDGQRAIRTPAWFLREDARVEPVRRELYVKPDDRLEVNEVSDRCRDVASQLAESLDQFQEAARCGRLDHLPPLPPVLTEGL